MSEMVSPPRLSVVVPTYQRRASVLRLLDALSKQTLPASSFEVIVAVDGSNDGTMEAVESFRAPYALRAVWQENRGRAAACNHGVKAAECELVVLLDDDMQPAPGLLAGHLAAHPAGSRRAVVGAAPILVDDDSPPLTRYYAAGFNGRLGKLGQPGYVLGFREAYSGNLSIRRDLFLAVGGFDPDFRVYGHEDYELALRLQRAGTELVFDPTALAYQHYEKDFASLARDSIARGTTSVVFAAKHPEVAASLGTARARRGSRFWRWVCPGLVTASGTLPLPRLVIRIIESLEKRGSPRLPRYYRLAIDYFYRLGVRSASQQSA